MVDIFKALSDETRLRILSVLLNGEMCVCEIEDCLSLTQSNASRHLTVLRNAGILSSRKCAQWAYYKLSEDFSGKDKELFDYLNIKLKQLPTYQDDFEKMQKSKQESLCNDDCKY